MAAPLGPRSSLANGCFAIRSRADARFVAIAGADAYRANKLARARATPFYFKPTGFGTYLLLDARAGCWRSTPQPPFAARGARRARRMGAVAQLRRRLLRQIGVEWTWPGRKAGHRRAGVTAAGRAARGQRFQFEPARGLQFPEATVGASGGAHKRINQDGTAFGFADLHLHITAELRAGGRVIHGKSFDPFGITEPWAVTSWITGPTGSLDLIGNLIRTGMPNAVHDIRGWPSFTGWPVHDTFTHQQTYYVWLEQAWKAGLRLAVAQTVEDEPICRLAPLERTPARRPRRSGWRSGARAAGLRRCPERWSQPRLVPARLQPEQARQVIQRGKLAVVIGMETSAPSAATSERRRDTPAPRSTAVWTCFTGWAFAACSWPTGSTTRSPGPPSSRARTATSSA